MNKKVLTIQDISCYGKCSITVALPVISSMGIETVILPTSILSTHTSGFTNYTYHDLASELTKITKHWESINLKFNCIYTGYIGKAFLVEKITDYINEIKDNNTLVVVDPVFADGGKIYPGMDLMYVEKVKQLSSVADLIIPNITEACYLANKPYLTVPYTKEEINDLAICLAKDLKVNNIMITGVKYEQNEIGVSYYNHQTGETKAVFTEEIPIMYHGTGDLFSSVIVGSLMQGLTIEEAMKVAAEFTKDCIKYTYQKIGNCYGVLFEENLPHLWNLLRNYQK